MADIPPSKTFVAELAFKQEYNVNEQRKFDNDVRRAKAIIEERLPTLAELKGIVELTLGGPYKDQNRTAPPIFVDARSSSPKILDAAPEDARIDATFSMRPELIVGVFEGTTSYTDALFADIRRFPSSWPTGNPIAAGRLIQLLAREVPYVLDPKKTWDPELLPKPSTDLEQIKRDVKEWGFGFVKDALSPEQLRIIKKAVLEQAAGEDKAGVGNSELPNTRVWNLINKGDEFIDLLNDPLIDELVPWLLGDDAILSSYSANIAKAGGKAQMLHRDQGSQGPPVWHMPYGIQIAYYLVDNTEEIGATRVIPKTHLGVHAPLNAFSTDGTIPASAPAGSALIFDSRLWHGTGINTREDLVRPVVLSYYIRPHLRTHEAIALHLHPDVEEKLPPRQKALLGFRQAGALGNVNGPLCPTKTFVKRNGDPVGRMRAQSPYLSYENGSA